MFGSFTLEELWLFQSILHDPCHPHHPQRAVNSIGEETVCSIVGDPQSNQTPYIDDPIPIPLVPFPKTHHTTLDLPKSKNE
jgi:hypothetical protein